MILREHLAVLWSSSDFTFTKLHMIEERTTLPPYGWITLDMVPIHKKASGAQFTVRLLFSLHNLLTSFFPL
ncbi:hypothetical protein BHE74_00006400 [Ensete ventricosum]|uniref:Uncharacterized protein n=1 Tax=Ensete ventricosum TaxID=4639 RepID=A0A444FKU9_ENSVE|nr:hypothetical protein GW17_00012514 [Ensete ventricosum]RWW84967.1 hypothetical protein BHE74_00006400 [Ensete ventricosum]RZR72088.1 hypothetical protein BHM03_00010262 [Ensete ventricosum]